MKTAATFSRGPPIVPRSPVFLAGALTEGARSLCACICLAAAHRPYNFPLRASKRSSSIPANPAAVNSSTFLTAAS